MSESNTPKNFRELSYIRHSKHFDACFSDPDRIERPAQWMREGTVDAWRHAQFYRMANPILDVDSGARWLTVGDGRCGTDAHYLQERGADVVASDISDTLLKVAYEAGFIKSYQAANAEALPFEDGSFDYVFCKEAYHHFPRPMIALYEMIRVSRKGVLLIEPNDNPILSKGSDGQDQIRYAHDSYETVGNYKYQLSSREIEKVALGLNLPVVAFNGLCMDYEQGVEEELVADNPASLQRIKNRIASSTEAVSKNPLRHRWPLLVAGIFKTPLASEMAKALEEYDYEIKELSRNPYIEE
ncbi:class I SAM-dependent methyltransferase [Pelagicoccus sp. SDUM812003]|uniref:class I SAM-dependent methyltransferase n=1 Tax=Pelagicoccus sp. SDUM812003 TaxID=3041267 RepID=UPI00280F5DF4|nr:class I SAM-dependent methyltransferase [Pelagicoccus sp. SDUM812003]MDQ8201573.1 class I SAM-dependent methyltransferase [Pelagicoccus sp. SDUM812003]